MTSGIHTVIYPVSDLARAKALFSRLSGAAPYVDEPYYVGFRLEGGQEIGLDPHGHRNGFTGPVAYWDVDDIELHVKQLLDAGGETLQAINDVGGGKLAAWVKDPDGNVIGLLQSP